VYEYQFCDAWISVRTYRPIVEVIYVPYDFPRIIIQPPRSISRYCMDCYMKHLKNKACLNMEVERIKGEIKRLPVPILNSTLDSSRVTSFKTNKKTKRKGRKRRHHASSYVQWKEEEYRFKIKEKRYKSRPWREKKKQSRVHERYHVCLEEHHQRIEMDPTYLLSKKEWVANGRSNGYDGMYDGWY
jgi:hypothetical protein